MHFIQTFGYTVHLGFGNVALALLVYVLGLGVGRDTGGLVNMCDLQHAKLFPRNIASYFTNTIPDDLTIWQANRTREKPCVHREMDFSITIVR